MGIAADLPEYDRLGYDPRVHVLVKYHIKKGIFPEGDRTNPPHPRGLSGGGIFRLAAAFPVKPQGEPQGEPRMLVAVMHSYHRRENCFVGTKVSIYLGNLYGRYPDEVRQFSEASLKLTRYGSLCKPGPRHLCSTITVNMSSINLADKLAGFEGHWQPRVVGQFNGHDLMVVKVKGDFVWHTHDNTDDFFLVLKGRITIRMREGDVSLGPGELFVVPKGVEHCPVAEEEAHLLLIEPTGTPNTGNAATAAPRHSI